MSSRHSAVSEHTRLSSTGEDGASAKSDSTVIDFNMSSNPPVTADAPTEDEIGGVGFAEGASQGGGMGGAA
jgi:hypothetical protein